MSFKEDVVKFLTPYRSSYDIVDTLKELLDDRVFLNSVSYVPPVYITMSAAEYIAQDLNSFFKGLNSHVTKESLNVYAERLPDAWKVAFKDYPPTLHAWLAIQLVTGSRLWYHCSEELGAFIYSKDLFEVHYNSRNVPRLDYIGPNNVPIDLPNGCINCADMFNRVILKEGAYLRTFNTTEVVNMARMFSSCNLPRNFTFGDAFDTSKVKDMSQMFQGCEIAKDVQLGDKFIIAKDTIITSMFADCVSFNLDKKKCFSNIDTITEDVFYQSRDDMLRAERDRAVREINYDHK